MLEIDLVAVISGKEQTRSAEVVRIANLLEEPVESELEFPLFSINSSLVVQIRDDYKVLLVILEIGIPLPGGVVDRRGSVGREGSVASIISNMERTPCDLAIVV